MRMHLSWLYSLGKPDWLATDIRLTCCMKEDFGTVPPIGEIKFYYWVVRYKQIPYPRHLVHKLTRLDTDELSNFEISVLLYHYEISYQFHFSFFSRPLFFFLIFIFMYLGRTSLTVCTALHLMQCNGVFLTSKETMSSPLGACCRLWVLSCWGSNPPFQESPISQKVFELALIMSQYPTDFEGFVLRMKYFILFMHSCKLTF